MYYLGKTAFGEVVSSINKFQLWLFTDFNPGNCKNQVKVFWLFHYLADIYTIPYDLPNQHAPRTVGLWS